MSTARFWPILLCSSKSLRNFNHAIVSGVSCRGVVRCDLEIWTIHKLLRSETRRVHNLLFHLEQLG